MRPSVFFTTHPVFTHSEFVEAHTATGRSERTSNNLLARYLEAGVAPRSPVQPTFGAATLPTRTTGQQSKPVLFVAHPGFEHQVIHRAFDLIPPPSAPQPENLDKFLQNGTRRPD